MAIDYYLEKMKEYESHLSVARNSYPNGKHSHIHSRGYFPAYCYMTEQFPFVFLRSLTLKDQNEDKITNKFISTDSYEVFQKHLKIKPQDWIYRTKDITYNVNSLGYRNKEFSEIKEWKNTIPVFGCSHIFGVGLADEDTIPFKIGLKTGKEPVNFGYPAGSNELILLNVLNLIEYVNPEDFPETIVIGWSCTDRMVFYSRDINNLGAWTLQNSGLDIDRPIDRYYKASIESPLNEYMKQFYLAKTVRAILKNRTKLVEFSHFPTTAKYMQCSLPLDNIKWDFARDAMHPGINAAEITAEKVVEELYDTIS